jgi:superfamily II DNA or RNA helicase
LALIIELINLSIVICSVKAKIVLKDQVTAKIEGLEPSTRRKLYQKYSIDVPYARHVTAYQLGRWDGKQHYFSMGGSTYLNLLTEILPIIEEEGYDIELDDRRQSFEFEFGLIDEDVFSHVNWPKGHPEAGTPVKLRDYQIGAVNGFVENPQSLQSITTSGGKTLITGALSYMVQDYGRSVVVVPNKSLVMQTAADYNLLGLDVGVYYGDKKEVNKTHTICTWQSLNIMFKNEKIDEFLDGVIAVVIDECFDGKSPVLTPTGWVPIEDISPGDQIINYNEKDGIFKTDTVVRQHKNLTTDDSEKMYELSFDDGRIIKVTGNHKFLTNLGWVRADELTEEHEITHYQRMASDLTLTSENFMKLIKKVEIEKPEEVFNLHIENDHNYIVNGAVVSNCHGIKGDALRDLLTGPMAHIPIRWGLTGTIPKGAYEFTPLLVSIGDVVNKITAVELQDKGVLSNCHINVVQTVECKEFKNYKEELKFLVTDTGRLEWLAKKILSVRGNGNVLVLVDRIATGQALQLLIPGSVFVSGKMKAIERKGHYDAVNDNDDDIIIATYGCAAVGINIPRLFSIFLLEPGKSFVRVIQSIGRGLRKAADKDHVDIYDITSTCKFSKRHLTTRKAYYNEVQYPFSISRTPR